MVATTIPGYRLVQIAHRGRRHELWRVERESDNRPLIAKLPAHPSRAPALRREHAILSALDIPGVVKAVAFDDRPGSPILFLQDAGPENLAAWLRKQSRLIDTSQFLTFAIAIASTVAELHARSLIHRDIAPFNLVADASGEHLTLVDFDSAISTAAVALHTTPDRLEGALAYMAPEQTGRLNRVVDHRADLYSVGITLYEMLCGAVPFSSPDPVELVHAHLARSPAPPASFHAGIPAVLSDIVLRLLEKMPEERYQSAAALVADLKEAQRQWRSKGEISAFALGQQDAARALPARQSFQGRERELHFLSEMIEGATEGKSGVAFVTGVAGIGKSTLVRKATASIRERGRLLQGKCDKVRKDVPYAPFAEAFETVFLDGLDDAAELRHRLEDGVGKNLPVLAATLPGLFDLVGEMPPVPSLGPVETERRFHLTFSALVRVLSADLPLVLFIDDLQWADSATLKLIEHLAGDPETPHLVIIGAFRSEDVGPHHPVAGMVDRIRETTENVHTLELSPLSLLEATHLCADILGVDSARAAPLAAHAHRKTDGNPFFVQQFLKSLVDSGHLVFDFAEGAWRWDMARVARRDGTTDAAQLVVDVMRRLPERTRRALEMAACFSHRVDVPLLSQILDQPADDTAADLWTAIEAGLLIPSDAKPAAASVSYQFLHDRVRQAAQSLRSDTEKQRIHLQIGTKLLEDASPATLEERLFDVVDQLNLGAALIAECEKRLALAKLNLRAGEKARAQAAYGPALGYLQKAIELLPRDPADTPHELRFRLYRHATECAYLSGELAVAENLANTALDLAQTAFEKAEIYNIRIGALASRGDNDEAISLGQVALALFDIELPTADAGAAVGAAFAAVRERMGNRAPENLFDLPQMTDPTTLARMELLSNLLSAAFVCDPMLFAVMAARMVRLSLDHGNSVYSAFAYAVYGMLLIAFEQDFAHGHACARLGVTLARRFGDPVQECRTLHVFCVFVNHWRAPLASSLPLVRAAIVRGLEAGELQYAVLAQSTLIVVVYHLGIELSQVQVELGSTLRLAHRTQNKAGHEYQVAYRQAARCLQGQTSARGSFDDDDFSERAFIESARDNPVAMGIYLSLRLEARYLFGDFQQARATVEQVAPLVPAISVLLRLPEYHLYSALTAAAEVDRDPSAKASAIEHITDHLRALERVAKSSPANFSAKHLLVEAERSRLEGRVGDAASRYDAAIDAARSAELLKDEALANELAGRFWRAQGRDRIASMYLREAVVIYRRWGAFAKAAAIEEENPSVAEDHLASPLPPRIALDSGGQAVDLLGLLKAAASISSEVAIDRVVEKLFEVCFELAGATRGSLLIAEDDELLVLAVGSTTEPVNLVRAPLSTASDLPAATIREAWEADTQIVAANASRHQRLLADPYFSENKIRSVLIMPIRRQATAMGILYLENRLIADAFSPDRTSVLRLLSSQIAISLENSSLFEKLRIESEQNARLYEEAQESIRLRNEFLSIASHELRTPITSIQLVVQGLASSLRGAPQTFPQMSRIAERQVQRLSSLVDELLTVSRIQEGRLNLSTERVNLVELVNEVVERFAFQAQQARSHVSVEGDAAVVGTWDRSRLDQVLTNLISNALKFGPGKPVEIHVSRAGDTARIAVSDHGIGIAPERISHVFKRFERAVPASRYGGLGLGLYIAYQIAQAHGGTIDVESEVGVGTTFVVTLPIAAAKADAADDGTTP